ncbi:MAG TPA: DUF47 family protein [Methanomicrobiales archaeon]|nr:DUF47 family protein [Methanomicrobiales archaeon]
MGLVEWLVPQDRIFFDLFEGLGNACLQASELLVTITDDYTDLKNRTHKMEELEHKGDEISHRIYEQLNRTFITPLEPEEINRLTTALDDILDYIEGTTLMMMNYGITDTDAAMKELAQLVHLSVAEIVLAVKAIRKIKDPSYVEEKCIEVNRLENLADDVTAHAITELFKGGDAVTIIKLKDIYQNLESATDKCEDAANVLSDIAIRHS